MGQAPFELLAGYGYNREKYHQLIKNKTKHNKDAEKICHYARKQEEN